MVKSILSLLVLLSSGNFLRPTCVVDGFTTIQQQKPSTSFPSKTVPMMTTGSSSSSSASSTTTEIPTSSSSNSFLSFESHIQQTQQQTLSDSTNISLTYLEVNGWLLTINGITILLDAILDGPLDFGIPQLFEGTKRILTKQNTKTIDPSTPSTTDSIVLDKLLSSQLKVDAIVLTQGLDDHAHVKSLRKLYELGKDQKEQLFTTPDTVPIIAPPSAKSALEQSGWYGSSTGIRFLNHREMTTIQNDDNGNAVKIRATSGALVGPPWQKRENGYIMSSATAGGDSKSLYIEPHVEFNSDELLKYAPGGRVDVVITPIEGQSIVSDKVFELVHGPKSAIQLIKTLKSKYVIPMYNGDIHTKGALADIVGQIGTSSEFQTMLQNEKVDAALMSEVKPGQDITLTI